MNTHRPVLDLCVDAYLPGTRFDPADLPRIDNALRASGQELAVAWRRQWQPGQELRIRFLDGDPVLHRRIREHASPYHVPRKILQVGDIPRTISGKITELAVRDIVHGRPVRNVDALANPGALDEYRNLEALQT